MYRKEYIDRMKATYVAKNTKQCEAYEVMIETMETIKSVLAKFDGKQITKRIVTAIKKELGEKSINISIVQQGYSMPTSYIRINLGSHYVFTKVGDNDYTYIDTQNVDFKLSEQSGYVGSMVLTNGNGRLDYGKTIENINEEINVLRKRQENITHNIANLDRYIEEGIAFEKMYREYEKNPVRWCPDIRNWNIFV